jgi:TetR/AcrR family transcriptional regulator, tetracycline repressor protein
MTSSRRPGQRAGLTRDDVLRAAREVLAERGLVGVSMRSVAQHLDVTPNALYSHVTGKDALIDALLDETLAAVPAPAAQSHDPAQAVQQLFAASYRTLLEHPDLIPLYLVRQGARGAYAQALGDLTLELLGRAGITGARAERALQVLIIHTIGVAAFNSHTPDDRAPVDIDQSLAWLVTGVLAEPTGTG